MRTATVIALTLLAASPAGAQPTIAELRERLATLEADRPDGVPQGTVLSIQYLIDTAERIDGSFTPQSESWRRTAATFLSRALDGHDPYPEQKGEIVNRGYDSPVSTSTQGYAVYLPPDYDPSRRWPLIVVLHGGSSNGNLFLGVVLGNNMSWLRYNQYLYNDFEPRWSPHVIVASPDGFGQVMWRWMGEQDVLDVIDDVSRHYAVDPDRVILAGLSNGGVGAYSIGARHAWRFGVVQAIAGAPSWLQYAGGRPLPVERTAMERYSGIHLIENTRNTDFRFYHGTSDTGPMKPRFVRELEARMEDLGMEPNATWYDAGHDILYRVHRHGRTFDSLGSTPRDPRPAEVTLVTGDYRANRQHWLTATRIESYPELATLRGAVEGATVRVTTEGARALSIDLRDAPLEGDDVTVVVDEGEVYSGPGAHLGHVLHLVKRDGSWTTGFPEVAEGQLEKRPGLSGPLTDPYRERMVHVYGTADSENADALRRAARRGARGWPLWLWRVSQEVVADTDVTDAMMADAHLVLYGTAGDNAVLERMKDDLPIRITEDAVVVGERRHEGRDVGVRFIYPNPLAPERYVVVQGGVTTGAVSHGHSLPDFLPDYLVYHGSIPRSRQRLATQRGTPLAIGYFDDYWRLPEQPPPGEGGQESPPDPVDAGTADAGDGGVADAGLLIPIPPAPPAPTRPRNFGVPRSDPAGLAVRRMWALLPSFHNYRAEIPGATWRVRPGSVWRVRPQQQCYDALREAGVPFRPIGDHPTPVPSPVEILGPVDGVWFRMTHEDRPLTISCEMAMRLPRLVTILKRHGVRGVDVMSAYRDRPRPSFHTFGLGLDLERFWTDRGWLTVEDHFEETPAHETCAAPRVSGRRARTMRRIACALYRTNLFSSVLTPNYNDGHRDHFHLDARPYDPRLFLR